MNEILTPLQLIITATAGWLNQQQAAVIDYLIEQNRVLLESHGGKCPRLTDDQRRRLAVKAKAVGRKGVPTLFLPDTLLGWHRKLIAMKHDYSNRRRGRGRPPIMKEIRELIVRFATDNSSWGYTRIMGALENLGHVVGRTTIANVLKDNGIVPAPERGKRTKWRDFLSTHWDLFAATDFFSVEVWTSRGLTTFYVCFSLNAPRAVSRLPGSRPIRTTRSWRKSLATSSIARAASFVASGTSFTTATASTRPSSSGSSRTVASRTIPIHATTLRSRSPFRCESAVERTEQYHTLLRTGDSRERLLGYVHYRILKSLSPSLMRFRSVHVGLQDELFRFDSRSAEREANDHD